MHIISIIYIVIKVWMNFLKITFGFWVLTICKVFNKIVMRQCTSFILPINSTLFILIWFKSFELNAVQTTLRFCFIRLIGLKLKWILRMVKSLIFWHIHFIFLWYGNFISCYACDFYIIIITSRISRGTWPWILWSKRNKLETLRVLTKISSWINRILPGIIIIKLRL